MVYTMLACIGALLLWALFLCWYLRRCSGGLGDGHLSLHAQAERMARGLKWKQVQRPSHVSGGRGTNSLSPCGFLGWTLDAFDFFIVVFLFDTLAKQFGVTKKDIVSNHNGDSRHASPGRVAVRSLGDRFGRRIPLMANVIYFSIIELLCGLRRASTRF